MAYTTIDNPELYFQIVLWSGDSNSPRTITLGGSEDMQPDLIWSKKRDGADYGQIYDSVRGFGASKELVPSDNFDEGNATNSSVGLGYISSVTSDGFVLTEGNHGTSSIRSLLNNHSGKTHVAWCWKESADAGFDIVSYTGNGSTRTVSHSLSAVPKVIICKNRDTVENWITYHEPLGAGKFLRLNQTNAETTSSNFWNDTTPTSSVFSVATGITVNNSGDDIVAYCFAEKQGFSKFGSYTGNGNTDGPFIYTGFKPAFVLQKKSSATQGWQLQDNKRDGYNGANDLLQPHDSAAESGVNRIDILSNGFKVITTDAGQNSSGGTYIYMAFAEAPFVNSKGVPCNAR